MKIKKAILLLGVGFLSIIFGLMIFDKKQVLETQEIQILSGISFHDYKLSGNFLITNIGETIKISGNVVNYNQIFSFLIPRDLSLFSYEYSSIQNYFTFFSLDGKKAFSVYKNNPVGLSDLCEKTILFDGDAPDSLLTGIVIYGGKQFMHLKMLFDSTQQDQYCVKDGGNYYLFQFTNFSPALIDRFFSNMQWI